ncbi:MAG TPA: 6-hydroxymethylpterin diphosphokinase MptE-like protein, partial [Spirochaetia bacterium]|nr:6-hydroxymethylpterin diphosphokinase MptE-like protein [Spirochaetia bacterium]
MNNNARKSIFETNVRSFAAALPMDVRTALASFDAGPDCSIEPTAAGIPTLRAFGRFVYSRHDPLGEAHRLVSKEIPRSTETCLFQNFGLGYHVEAFLHLFPQGRAVVVEPDLEWFAEALAARDMSELLSDERLVFVLASEPEAVVQILDDSFHAAVHVVRLRGLEDKNREYFERLDAELQALASRRSINLNTLARFGKLWVRNLIHNVDVVARSPGIRGLARRLAGFPALILAAGPSLDEVLPYLRALRERFVVVSVDTSYRAALAAGVVPDFLLVVDPQYWNSRHLDGQPLDGTILVSESSTYPGVFHRASGPLYLCGSLFPLGSFLERQVDEKGRLGAGGSVSTTAWDFARVLGCGPLVFAGLDLGFPGSSTHFRGGFFEERVHQLARRTSPAESMSFHALRDASPYYETNNMGGATLTDHRLIVYKWWFENQMKIHPEAKTWSLSKQGIRIAGIDLRSVDELMQLPPVRPAIDKAIGPMRSFHAGPLAEAQASYPETTRRLSRAVADLKHELSQLISAGSAGIDASRDLEEAVARGRPLEPSLERLKTIDREITALSSRDVAGFL